MTWPRATCKVCNRSFALITRCGGQWSFPFHKDSYSRNALECDGSKETAKEFAK